jgi:hypothetical protein
MSSNTIDLRPPQANQAPPAQPAKWKRRLNPRRWARRTQLATGGLLLVGLSAGLVTVFYDSGPIPRSARKEIDFPLYYPKTLPPGYSVDARSFTQKDKVVIFSIKPPHGKNIAVSEQHLPTGLDLSVHKNPAGIKLPDERNFTTGAGQAQVSLWGDKMVSSLVTEDTWIILNVTGITPTDVDAVTSSFKRL